MEMSPDRMLYGDFFSPSVIFPVVVLMKEGHLLFNDALNTFYLRLYGVRHMVNDHSDKRERKHAAVTWATISD